MRIMVHLEDAARDAMKKSASGRSAAVSRRLTGLRRVWIAMALLALSLVAAPAAAQGDCRYPDDWDDMAWFRGCIQQHGLDGLEWGL